MPEGRKPNIVFILSDQHRHCALPGVDGCEVEAPNLRAMARNGLSLGHCYSNAPVCGPARGMLMTGHWPSETGMSGNDFELPSTPHSLGFRMRDAGYHTLYIGKWHLHGGDAEPDSNCRWVPPGPDRHGFDRLLIWNRTNDHWDSHYYAEADGTPCDYEGYNATGMADQSISLISEYASSERPFFLWVNLNPPHPPLDDAPEPFLDLYRDRDLKMRDNVPPDYASGRELVPAGGRYKDPCMTLKEQHAQYYGHVSAIDHEIGRIRDHLRGLGLADDTVLVYASDHGEMLGSHGLLRKGQFLQESARVPFIAEGPGIDARGESTLMSTIDVYPTLLGFAGSRDHEGRGVDCSSALRGGPGCGAEEALHFFSRDPHQRLGIRTRGYLYFGRPEQEFLYDTEADPFETRNVADDPDYREIKARLVRRMRRRVDEAWSHGEWTGPERDASLAANESEESNRE